MGQSEAVDEGQQYNFTKKRKKKGQLKTKTDIQNTTKKTKD